MLPKVRRFLNNNNNSNPTNNQFTRSNSSSSDSADENNLYTQTLLYIVHVDEIEADQQEKQLSSKIIRRVSKRTTASFNERDGQMPVATPPSFSFSNPFRRLNNLLKSTQSPSTPNLNVTPLCTSTAKKSSQRPQHRKSHELFPPPPPEFLEPEPQPIIRATGTGLKDGFSDDYCHFDLTAPNAELQKLVIAIDGPSKADIQIEVIETGIYRVYYKCQLPGSYHLSLTYNGVHIDHSPYHLTLHARPAQEQIVPLPNTPTRVTIEPMEFYVNIPSMVTVHPETPCNVFQAYIQAPQGNINLPITVHKSAKSENYEIYFKPTTCGNHWLNINLNHLPMIDNPCRFIIHSCSSMKSLDASKEVLFNAYTGELSQFFVSKSPYDSASKNGKFSVSINGPSTVFLDANESEYGYEFHYKPNRSGKYFITVKSSGKHIQGSPFTCRVHDTQTSSCQTLLPAPIRSSHADFDLLRSSMTGDPSQICVFGAGLYEAKKRRKASFKIDASQTGPGLLLVGLYSPLGPFERLVIKRIMPSSPGFIYKVSYRVRHRGEYLLTILYGLNMEHVPGSPYVVLVE